MALLGQMRLRIWDVEHGACAMIQHINGLHGGKLAMIDSGDTAAWSPSTYIKHVMGRNTLDYLFITNADQDHMSDLQGLFDSGIHVATLIRNPSYTASEMRAIKRVSGPLTRDAERYVAMCESFTHPVLEPFNTSMGGITETHYWNKYPFFTDTNDLSLAIFVTFGGFKILFPGDLEKEGWKSLLELQAFRDDLHSLDVLVASHHGRESGFCSDVFKYCRPSCVVISDKAIEHETQETVPDYRAVVRETGVHVKTTGKQRHVLTTRRDGWIQFNVGSSGQYTIETEYMG